MAPPVCTVSPTLSTAPQSRTVHSVNVAAPLASKQHNVVSSELMDSVENTIDEFLNENLPGAPVFTSDEEDEPFSVLPRTSSPANTSEIVIPSDDEECDLLRSKLQKKSQSKSQYIDSDQADDSDRDVTYNPERKLTWVTLMKGVLQKRRRKSLATLFPQKKTSRFK